MKKTVLKVCITCLKCKTNILKAVAKLPGINELTVDDEKGTLTVIGDVDPVCVANRLKKMGKLIEIISVGPPKPPEKPKPEPKPDSKPKPDPKPPLPSCCDKCQFAMIIYDDVLHCSHLLTCMHFTPEGQVHLTVKRDDPVLSKRHKS